MGLFDFLFKTNKSGDKAAKSNAHSSPNNTDTRNMGSKDNWHDAVGISISDEFEATVYERRVYGIKVSFIHNGNKYYGFVHKTDMSSSIKNAMNLFSVGEKVWVKVIGFDEKEHVQLKLKYLKKGDPLPSKQQIEIGKRCNCIVKEIKDRCVFVSIEEYEGITGIIGIQDMSHAFVTHPSFMFKEGERISAITAEQTSKESVWLSFKDTQDTSIYQVGQDIAVHLVNKDSEHQNLLVVTRDDNKMLAYIPYNEISWTNDTSLQGQQDFNVRIKSVDTQNGRCKLICSIRELKENPWEKAVYTKGLNIQVTVDSYAEKGIKITTADNYKLPGIIWKNQVTWLKDEDNVAEEDYPNLCSKIDVCILKFVPEKQILYCSIRELQDDPWLHIKIGDTVRGQVCTKSDSYLVRLKSGIECECRDNGKLESYKEYNFIVTGIDSQQKRVEVSQQLLQRADYYANKALDFFKQRSVSLSTVKWEDSNKHITYVLLPQNILFKGEAIALPYLELCIQMLKYNIPLQFKELKRSDKNPDIVFVSVDMTDVGFTASTVEFRKIQKRVLTAKVICETKKHFIVNVVGVLGYFEKSESLNIKDGDEVTVMLAKEQDNPMQFYKFNLINEKKENGVENTSNEDFLTEDEKKVIDEKDLVLINSLQEEMPYINRNNCHVFNEQVCLGYDKNLKPKISHFYEKEGIDLSQQNFWLSMKINPKTNKQTVAIFNSDESIILCNATDNRFTITNVYCSKEDAKAQNILNCFSRKNNLVLPGSKLRICAYLDTGNFDFKRLNTMLSQQYTIVNNILPELSSKVKDRKKEIGQEYLILSNFLQFQKNKEEKRLQDLELSFDSKSVRLGAFEDKGCIVLEDADCSIFFAENEDKQAIKLTPYGTEKGIPGILAMDDDENYFVYFNSERELSTYCHDGFTLTPAANVYHLKIQDASVKEFVFKNPLLDKLNEGTLCPPKTDLNLEFLNPIFNQVEEGNNQPVAIRKAVGNQDIFLIQGPPGTGKTSVIIEIIRQLAKKGERVLVCSQAHSAVKNIYDRLLDADDSIRIGFLDDERTMRAMTFKDHRIFLKRNILMLNDLQKDRDNRTGAIPSYDDYPDYLREFYQNQHLQLLKDAQDNSDSCSTMIEIADDFLKEIESNKTDGDNRFYMASHIHSLQVVMGTCIGIGTNPTIKKSGIKFDTLIIDEAGKANMAETNVPMSLAKKYILVGDHNQLPPYMDIQEVEEFKSSDEAKETDDAKIKPALSTSLFEDFLNDPSFPEESKVLLNYQYRMNPTIGQMISNLFYEGKLNNGMGTDKQACELESFSAPITFCDTGKTRSVQWHDPYEQNTGNGSIYNPCEINFICKEIVPKIENLLIKNHNLSIGIVAPYSEQVRRLKKELRGSAYHLENCVYTIDNIQGQEYDIVILSFVRSFRGRRSVGFLDDLRRLNVALSRAKKKLIMVGNLDTLCRPEAHKQNGLGGKLPVEVFASLKKVSIRHAGYNNIDKFKQHGIVPGHVFPDCPITCKNNNGIIRYKFSIRIEGKNGKEEVIEQTFSPYDYGNKLMQDGECFDFRYVAENSKDSDRPLFEIVPKKVEATIIECNKNKGNIKLLDGSTQKVVFDARNWIFKQLLAGDMKGLTIPFVLKGHSASLDAETLRQNVANLSCLKRRNFTVQVISVQEKGFWVWCSTERVLGFIVKRASLPSINLGDKLECYVHDKKEESVTFNYLKKRQ